MRSDSYGPSVEKPRLSRRGLLAGLVYAGAIAALPTFGKAAAVESAERGQRSLAVRLGDLGPRMIDAGVIDPERFVAVYRRSGEPLTGAQRRALTEGSDEPIALTPRNAHFLLNFFWGVGIGNANPILTQGAMTRRGLSGISRFASTGGWILGARRPMELYAAFDLIPLDPAQQSRLESVAAGVYRPCCNNPTSFPDCNHGMAMLGLLERMAAEGADEPALYQVALAANRIWYPRQSMGVAVFLSIEENSTPQQVPQRAIGGELFSAAGYRRVENWLAARGMTPKSRGGNGGCSV